jgi:hypothetical protein
VIVVAEAEMESVGIDPMARATSSGNRRQGMGTQLPSGKVLQHRK